MFWLSSKHFNRAAPYFYLFLQEYNYITLAFIIYMFWVYQKCLISNRRLTIELEEKFVTYEDIRKLPIPKRYFKYWFQGHILITFKLSIVLGYVFSMWYIFEKLIR